MFQFYAQNELISNVMPTTGLKIFGTGGMLAIFSKQFEDIWASGLLITGVLVMEFGPILAWYRIPAAEEFFFVFNDAPNVLYRWKIWTADRPIQHPDSSTIKLCSCNSCSIYTHTHIYLYIYIYIYPYIYIALYIVRGISPHPPWVCSIHLGDAGVTLGPFSNVNDRIMLMSDAVSSEGPKTTMFFCNWCWGTLLFTVLHKLLHRLESLCPSLLLRDSASLRHPFYS